MTVTINVTQRDIDRGRDCHCTECPIALAAKRKFRSRSVEVFDDFIRIGGDFGYKLPVEARIFVSAFDFDRKSPNVKPFRFTLEV